MSSEPMSQLLCALRSTGMVSTTDMTKITTCGVCMWVVCGIVVECFGLGGPPVAIQRGVSIQTIRAIEDRVRLCVTLWTKTQPAITRREYKQTKQTNKYKICTSIDASSYNYREI